jgi:hypothetical protein
MKCQVGRSPSPVALSGQLLVSSRRVPDGARGRIRCGRDGEFVFAAGVILVRRSHVLPLRQGHPGTGIACTHGARAGVRLRAGLTGRSRKTRDAAQQELRAPGGLCGQADQLSTVQNPGAI